MTTLVIGIFGHRSDAVLAIEALKDSGIKKKQISAVTKQKSTLELISKDTGIGKIESGAGNAGLFGTAREVGVGLNMINDTAVAAGPAARKLAGADLEADGLTVSLIGIGIPEADAAKYAEHAEMERIIVIVEVEEDQNKQVSTIMGQHDAIPFTSAE
ncbi:general stress protein [Paenibacillus camerounensis]|uniref:general stress protein n=1 Tax=Paenibacillus camerounensis TaxID=1243663 RepID=UPI0005AA38B7|nr:general stress protein [Paenibacillus camerounensis]